MNRRIKFRGKCDGKWIYGNLLYIAPFVIANTISQFTGQYDFNGKEIYEGDILKSIEDPVDYFQVIWSDDKSAFVTDILTDHLNFLYEWKDFYIVCDNIYDNPKFFEE